MTTLFDTNILVDYLNGRAEARREIEAASNRAISIVTWMEVLVGAASAAEQDVIEMFLRDFRVVDLTHRIARKAIEARIDHRLRLPDAIVFASAEAESATLVTRATKDFPRGHFRVRVPY